MREVLTEVAEVLAAGERLVLATVTAVAGSAPFAPDATLAVSGSADAPIVHGSVSGGCVEGAIVETAAGMLGNAPATPEDETRQWFSAERLGFDSTNGCGDVEVAFGLISPDALPALRDALAAHERGEASLWCGVSLPAPPDLLIYGATDFAAALSQQGLALGYRVTVVDARPLFATAQRFPGAQTIVRWPSEHLADFAVRPDTVIIDVTHDEKFSVPLLGAALISPAGYVGALGSRRSAAVRREHLAEAGLGPAEIGALHMPAGLDLQASSPAATAVAVFAEILAASPAAESVAATSRPLRELDGPIHRGIGDQG